MSATSSEADEDGLTRWARSMSSRHSSLLDVAEPVDDETVRGVNADRHKPFLPDGGEPDAWKI